MVITARYKESTRLQFRLNTEDVTALRVRSSDRSAIIRAMFRQFLTQIEKYPASRLPNYTLRKDNQFISIRIKITEYNRFCRLCDRRKLSLSNTARAFIFKYLYKVA